MEKQNSTEFQIDDKENQSFSIREFLGVCASKWKWILASVVIFTLGGVFYALKQPSLYERTASVLIKDQDAGSSVGDAAEAFSSMGLVATKTNVNNELIAFTSPSVIYEVVKRLGLNVSYTSPGRFHDNTLYGTTLPLVFSFPSLKEQESASLKAEIKPDGEIELSDFKKFVDGKAVKYDKTVKCRVNTARVRTPLGEVMIRPNVKYTGTIPDDGLTINVKRIGMQAATDKYQAIVTGQLHNREADIIDLKAVSVSAEIDTDLLNTIIEVYNEYWVEDKNRIAVATSNFINERLKVIEGELGEVDANISQYKSANQVPDLTTAADLYMRQSAKTGEDILELSNKLSMAKYVSAYLNNPQNRNSVIPANTGIGDFNIENQIGSYNSMLLDKMNLLENSSPNNPIVKSYEGKLNGMRQSIVSAVNSHIVALSKSLGYAKSSQSSSLDKIESNPRQAKYLLSVERQQKVKESLYLYLLQKREENEITQTFTAYNTRIITPPTGPLGPVAPKRSMIVLIAFMLGLVIPMAAIYVMQLLNTKVRNKKDIESLQIPFAGEIPITEAEAHKKWYLKKKDDDETITLEVRPGLRDNINEAFKVVRSNFDFMSTSKKNVILVTSMNAGSGKSFISLNMAATYALKGKKALVIDSDLRHGSISKFINNPLHGVTDYLAGNNDDWRQNVKAVDNHPNLYLLPIGSMPPNPLELLENGRYQKLVEEAREEYDIVILDCPPDGIVADSFTIAPVADRSVFVVRAGLLEKSLLSEIAKIYKEKRYPGMCLILNCVKDSTSGRYGYRYGYHRYHNYYGSKK